MALWQAADCWHYRSSLHLFLTNYKSITAKGKDEKKTLVTLICVCESQISRAKAEQITCLQLFCLPHVSQKGDKQLLRMIFEYYSKQCLILKNKINSALVRHKERASGLQPGFTQNVSRPHLFSGLEPLEHLPNRHIIHTSSSVMLMTTATILLAVEVKQCLLQVILTTGLFRESSAQKLQRIHYLHFQFCFPQQQ